MYLCAVFSVHSSKLPAIYRQILIVRQFAITTKTNQNVNFGIVRVVRNLLEQVVVQFQKRRIFKINCSVTT